MFRLIQFCTILGTTYIAAQATKKLKAHAQSKNQIPKDHQNLKPLSREELINKLRTETFDLLVVGGGATGCGVAIDASTRGLKVALVEKNDFSSGTSSRSTKLVHGGVRYLEKAFLNFDWEQFQLVREALTERAYFLANAPHLTNAIPIMIPLYKWWQVPYYWLGAKMYDLVAGRQGLQWSYYLNKTRARAEFPMLKTDKLKGAIVYFDGQHNDTRTNVILACTAASHGACVANHIEVISLVKEAKTIQGAKVKDRLTGEEWEIKSKGVINATGPFVDKLRKMDDPNVKDIIVPSAGIHVVLPNYFSPSRMGLLDPATSDGRVIFFLPWQNNTIAGTTDSPVELTENPQPLEEEIHWVLKEIANYLPPEISVQRSDVLAAWSGIRPLVRDPKALEKDSNTQSLVRSHLVLPSESGLLTITGGKWTTYRKMAEDTVDEAIKLFNLTPKNDCITKDLKLLGAQYYTPITYIKLIQDFGIDLRCALHLAKHYGDRAFTVAKLSKETGKRWPVFGQRLSPVYFFIDGEVRYAVRYEYAVTAVDVIAHRTPLAFLNANAALDALPTVISIMSEELNWDKPRQIQEYESAKEFLRTMGLDLWKDDVRSKFNTLSLKKYRAIFGALDTSHKGTISLSAIKSALHTFKEEFDTMQLETEYLQVAKDPSKGIRFDEFLEILHHLSDTDGDPQKKALVSALERVAEHLSKKIDVDRSGGGL